MKMIKLAKLKTRKGGLGKNEHPVGLTTYKGNSGKSRGNEKNLFPGGSKTRKGGPGKNGMIKKNKQNKSKHAKSIDHKCDTQGVLSVKAPSNDGAIKEVLFSTSWAIKYSSLPSAMVSMRLSNDIISKGDFHKHVLEHEPLRAQYSNVLSISMKLCLQIANHYALQAFIHA